MELPDYSIDQCAAESSHRHLGADYRALGLECWAHHQLLRWVTFGMRLKDLDGASRCFQAARNSLTKCFGLKNPEHEERISTAKATPSSNHLCIAIMAVSIPCFVQQKVQQQIRGLRSL